jgi:cytochrome c-type biogenesis protein CcmE
VLTLLILLAASFCVALFIFAMRREMRAFYMRARIAYARASSRN